MNYVLKWDSSESDVGVSINSNLKPSAQCQKGARTASNCQIVNQWLTWVKDSKKRVTRETILLINIIQQQSRLDVRK